MTATEDQHAGNDSTSESDDHLCDTAFAQFDLSDAITQGLNEAGFRYCTPIQAQALPIALTGQDVAGQAQTGTGKTAAFLVALFQRLLGNAPAEARRDHQPRALIVAPTRELAIQIHADAVHLGQHTGLGCALAYGGTDYDKQRNAIRAGCDVLIGTPGRLIDYLKQGVFDLKQLEVAVLDEADRMFDLGFISDIRYLFRRMPPPDQRLSMLFSATLSLRVTELAFEHMNHPQHVESQPEQVTADGVEQVVYYPANDEKIRLLIGLLQQTEPARALVFVNTRRGTEWVGRHLEGNGIATAVLSGEVPQRKRQRLLEDFQQGRIGVLIATDVAARGLHIPAVSHVFNFDLPASGDDYVHRIGRTARAGATGHAVSFACEDTAFYVPEIEATLGISLPSAPVTTELLPEIAQPAPPANRRKGNKSAQGGAGKGAPASESAAKDNNADNPNGGRSRRRRRGRGKAATST